MRIGVFLHQSPWGDIDEEAMGKGLGGRETALVQLAVNWASQGHDVFAFVPRSNTRISAGVKWIPMEQVISIAPVLDLDMFVSWENAEVLAQLGGAKVGVRVIEMQVAHLQSSVPLESCTDYIAVLSEWAGDFLHEQHPNFPRENIVVFPNGVDLDRFTEKRTMIADDEPPTFIYSSSPDRGLHHLLNMWPDIRYALADYSDQTPVLHVCYGVENFLQHSRWSHKCDGPRALQIESGMNQKGVQYHGKIGQDKLADLMINSDALLYPCDTMSHTETGCITIVEALAAHTEVVTTNCDCLGSEFGHLTHQSPMPLDYEDYIEKVVDAMTGEFICDYDDREKFILSRGWDNISYDWIDWLGNL